MIYFLQALFGVKNYTFPLCIFPPKIMKNIYLMKYSLHCHTCNIFAQDFILRISSQRNELVIYYNNAVLKEWVRYSSEIMLKSHLAQNISIHSCGGAISKKVRNLWCCYDFAMITVNARLQKICARDNIFCRLNFLWYVSNCFWHIKDHVPPPSGVCFVLFENNQIVTIAIVCFGNFSLKWY